LQTERALAQRDGGVELAVEARLTRVGSDEARTCWRAGSCQVDEPLADVDARDHETSPCQRVRVATGSASDVEHALSGPEGEGVDEELDFLFGSLGEAVSEVGGAEVLGDGLEPVRATALLS
jgi:hypothetical protein